MDETQNWIDRNLQPSEEEYSGIIDEFGNELLIGEEVLVTGDGEYMREDCLWTWLNDQVSEESDLTELAAMIEFLDDDHAQAKGKQPPKQAPKQPPTHDAAKALIDSCQALAELINAKDGSQQTAKSVYAYFCNQVVGKEIPTSQLNMKQIKDIQSKAAAMFNEYQAK